MTITRNAANAESCCARTMATAAVHSTVANGPRVVAIADARAGWHQMAVSRVSRRPPFDHADAALMGAVDWIELVEVPDVYAYVRQYSARQQTVIVRWPRTLVHVIYAGRAATRCDVASR